MIFNQIKSTDGTGTISYLIADDTSRNGIIIDPNLEDLNNLVELIKQQRIKLKYVIDTHTHADHVSAAGELKKIFGSKLLMHENTKNKWKVVDEGDKFGIGDILRSNAALEIDKYLQDEEEMTVDSLNIKFLFTPGHTDNHISVMIEDKLFTGDLLLIGQAGRSDLPGGNAEEQYNSLFNKVLQLSENTKIYPGHDYEDNEFSLLTHEKMNNPFLKPQTKEQYVEFVKDFFPPISETTINGKATLQCGTKRVVTESDEPFKNIDAEQLAKMMMNDKDIYLLDVREPFELSAFGVIPGVVNIPVRQVISRINELPDNKKIIVVCQSGNRSYEVAHYLSSHGFSNIYNLEGGTSGWLYSPASSQFSKVS